MFGEENSLTECLHGILYGVELLRDFSGRHSCVYESCDEEKFCPAYAGSLKRAGSGTFRKDTSLNPRLFCGRLKKTRRRENGIGKTKVRSKKRMEIPKVSEPEQWDAPLVHKDDMSSDQGALEIPAFLAGSV